MRPDTTKGMLLFGMVLGVTFAFIVILSHSNSVEEPLLRMLKQGGFLLMLAAGSIFGAILSAYGMFHDWFYKRTGKKSRNSTVAVFCSPALISILILFLMGDQTQTLFSRLVLYLAGGALLIGLCLIQIPNRRRN